MDFSSPYNLGTIARESTIGWKNGRVHTKISTHQCTLHTRTQQNIWWSGYFPYEKKIICTTDPYLSIHSARRLCTFSVSISKWTTQQSLPYASPRCEIRNWAMKNRNWATCRTDQNSVLSKAVTSGITKISEKLTACFGKRCDIDWWVVRNS